MAGKNGNRAGLAMTDKLDEISLELCAIHAQLHSLELATEEGGIANLGGESLEIILNETRRRVFKLREYVNHGPTGNDKSNNAI
jgi:hypothetical protein